MGCGPPIIMMTVWKDHWGRRPLVFASSWVCGLILGILYQYEICLPNVPCTSDNLVSILQYTNPNFLLGDGDSALLLGVNLYGILLCWALCIFWFFAYDAYYMASGIKPEPCVMYRQADLDLIKDEETPKENTVAEYKKEEPATTQASSESKQAEPAQSTVTSQPAAQPAEQAVVVKAPEVVAEVPAVKAEIAAEVVVKAPETVPATQESATSSQGYQQLDS